MVPPPILREQIPSLSPEVEEVVFTALAKDPKYRFGSIQAFANALKQAFQNQQEVLPIPDQQHITANQSTIAATTTPPMLQRQSAEPATIINTPANPLIAQPPVSSVTPQPAPALNTPSASKERVFPSADETIAPTLISRPEPATQLISAPSIEDQSPSAAPRVVSRRAVLVTGVAAAGVAIAGGFTWYLLSHTSSSSRPAATVTNITPTAVQPSPTSQTAQPITNMVAQDTFHRPDQTFWGTASDGQKWGGQANVSSQFKIAGDLGQINRKANGQSLYTATLGPAVTDTELLISASLSAFNSSHIGAALRWQDDQNYYKVLIDQNQLRLFKRVNNLTSLLQRTSFAAQPNTSYTIRFRIVGATLKAKAWQTGSTEPSTWMATATDNSFQSGLAGLRPQLAQNVTLQVSLFTLSMASN